MTLTQGGEQFPGQTEAPLLDPSKLKDATDQQIAELQAEADTWAMQAGEATPRRRVFSDVADMASEAKGLKEDKPKGQLYRDKDGMMSLGSAEDVRKADTYRELVGGPFDQSDRNPEQFAQTLKVAARRVDAISETHSGLGTIERQPLGENGIDEKIVQKIDAPHFSFETDTDSNSSDKAHIIDLVDPEAPGVIGSEIIITEHITPEGEELIDMTLDSEPVTEENAASVDAVIDAIEEDVAELEAAKAPEVPEAELEPEIVLEGTDTAETSASAEVDTTEAEVPVKERPVESLPEKQKQSPNRAIMGAFSGYLHGPSSKVIHETLSKIAAEQGIDVRDLNERLNKANINTSPAAVAALKRLQSTGVRPGSSVWTERPGNHSMIAKAAGDAQQALEQTVRELLVEEEKL